MRLLRVKELISSLALILGACGNDGEGNDDSASGENVEKVTEITKDIVFATTTGGKAMTLDFYPATTGNGPHPLVITVHGGGFTKGDKSTAEGLSFQTGLNGRGISMMSVNYRFASEVTLAYIMGDVRCAIRYARRYAETYDIDPNRIGIHGSSAGAYLANLTAVAPEDSWDARDYVDPHDGYSSRVQSLVDWYGATDVTEEFAGFPWSLRLSLLGSTNPSWDTLIAASPASQVDAGDPPALIMNGMDDVIIPYTQAQTFHDAYVAAGIASQATLVLVENAQHGFMPTTQGVDTSPTLGEIILMTEEWFETTLAQ